MIGMFHLHPPKTGGTSLITALLNHCEEFKSQYGHLYSKQVFDHLSPKTVDINVGHAVTLGVRDPYDRVLSLTRWINRIGVYSVHYNVQSHFKEAKRYSKLDWDTKPKGMKHTPYRWAIQATLCDWEKSVPDGCEVIPIRFENYYNEVKGIYPTLEGIPHIHYVPESIPAEHVLENFDSQETLDKFNDMYSCDCERFNYPVIDRIEDFYQKYLQ